MCSGYKWLCVSILPRGMGWPLARKKYGEMFKPGVKFWWLFGWFICFKALFENLTKNQTGLEGCTIVQQFFFTCIQYISGCPNKWKHLGYDPTCIWTTSRPGPWPTSSSSNHSSLKAFLRLSEIHNYIVFLLFVFERLFVCFLVFWALK